MKRKPKSKNKQKQAVASQIPQVATDWAPRSTEPAVTPVRPAPAHQPNLVALGLFGVAFLISLYLAWQSATGSSVAGCGADSGCGQVLKSRWGFLLGAPVSLLGAMLYGFLLWGEAQRRELDPLFGRLQTGAGVLVLAGAVWFTCVQAFVLRAFCPWCCTAHLLASAAVLVTWRNRATSYRPTHTMAVAIPVGLVAGLAILQAVTPKPEQIQRVNLASATNSVASSAKIDLDPSQLPWIGTRGAPVTAVAVTDYTCPHCRELHHTLTQAGDQQAGRFEVALLPGYYEEDARDLHRVMLALWKIDPAQYKRYSEALVQGAIDANAAALLGTVRGELGDRFYEQAWQHADWIDDTLRLGQQVMANNQRAGISTLPQLMVGQEVIGGSPRLETVLAKLEEAPPGLPDLVKPRVVTVSAPEVPQTQPNPTVPTRVNPLLAAMTNQLAGGGGSGGSSGEGSRIEFEQITNDFGRVTKGDVLTAEFRFKNTGTGPLEILKLQPTCGCTTIGNWQQTVQPGESGSFEVQLDTTKFSGPVTKQISLETTDADGPDKLYLVADVWAPVQVSASVVSFGSVLKGSTVDPRPIDITVQEGESIEIKEIICTNSYFQTKLETVEAGRKYVLTVSIPELGEKMESGEIIIPLGHPKLEEIRIPVYSSPVDPMVVQPTTIVPRIDPTGAPAVAAVTIFCHDPEVRPFEITDYTYTGKEDVTVTLDMQPGYKWGTLRITFPAGFDATAAQKEGAQVKFKTNHPDHPEVSVPIRPAFSPPQARVQ